MKLLLVVILIAGAQSAPRPQFTEVGHLGHFEIVAAERSINLPDGCTFISSTQNREGDIIKGEYSYEDPVGSKITVTYQVNTDGSNYLEKRRITKGYKIEGNQSEQALVTHGNKHRVIKVGHTIRLMPFVVHSVEEQSHVLQQDQSAVLAQQKAEQAALLAQQQREEAERLAQQKACANKVVQSVKTDLEPIIIQIIRQTVRNSNADLTQYDNLVGVIISQLRPVILNEVNSALSGSTRCDNLNADDLTNRIVVEITPFVRRALEEQIRELESAQAALLAQQKREEAKRLQAALLAQQQREEAERLAQQGNIVQSIIAQLDPFIKTTISDALGSQTTTVLDQNTQVQLSNSQSQRITSRILSQLRSRVESATTQFLEGSASSVSNNVVVDNVIAQFQPQIIRAIEGDATIQQTFSSGSFVGSDAFSDLFGQIITALRGIILQQIRAWRASQIVVQPVPVVPVAPAGGNAITSIFGTGGANSVQVETPNYNYEYNHASSRSLD